MRSIPGRLCPRHSSATSLPIPALDSSVRAVLRSPCSVHGRPKAELAIEASLVAPAIAGYRRAAVPLSVNTNGPRRGVDASSAIAALDNGTSLIDAGLVPPRRTVSSTGRHQLRGQRIPPTSSRRQPVREQHADDSVERPRRRFVAAQIGSQLGVFQIALASRANPLSLSW